MHLCAAIRLPPCTHCPSGLLSKRASLSSLHFDPPAHVNAWMHEITFGDILKTTRLSKQNDIRRCKFAKKPKSACPVKKRSPLFLSTGPAEPAFLSRTIQQHMLPRGGLSHAQRPSLRTGEKVAHLNLADSTGQARAGASAQLGCWQRAGGLAVELLRRARPRLYQRNFR